MAKEITGYVKLQIKEGKQTQLHQLDPHWDKEDKHNGACSFNKKQKL